MEDVVEDIVVLLVEDSHPSYLKLVPFLTHVVELYFNDDIGVFEQSIDPEYLLTCICSPLQVTFVDDVISPTQIPGK